MISSTERAIGYRLNTLESYCVDITVAISAINANDFPKHIQPPGLCDSDAIWSMKWKYHFEILDSKIQAINDKLTPLITLFSDHVTARQLLKKSPEFKGKQCFINTFKTPCTLSLF